MKKERIYTIIYGLLLLLLLFGTSAYGQYAYTITTDPLGELQIETSTEESYMAPLDVVNTEGVKTISIFLKNKIKTIKTRVSLNTEGSVTISVNIDKEGNVTPLSVVNGENLAIGNMLLGYIKDINRVEPITYNGVPKEKTIQIPVIFEK